MQFSRHIGIDYSGAETSTSFLPGLRVYMTEGEGSAREVLHPHIPRRHWTRAVVAEWLVERLKEETPSLIGIDHGFSFPVAYFDRHGVPRDWPSFLADFVAHWPTSEEGVYVEEIRKGEVGAGAARMGDSRWRRLTELRAGGAKSVFHFDVQGSVASPPIAVSRGCTGFASRLASECISGRSMASKFQKESRRSSRSIRHSSPGNSRAIPP